MTACPLCHPTDETVLWRDDRCRVILATEADYPGFLRVIHHAHVREMSELDGAARGHLMQIVFACEAALIEVMRPDKINLASLGNVVPHLHWHVIPRFADDPHFPAPVWAAKSRAGRVATPPDSGALIQSLKMHLRAVSQD